MLHKGQIVEIPEHSHLYNALRCEFQSKEQELLCRSQPPKYTLYDGILVDGHHGIEGFKIGQRKHLGVSGRRNPLYIIALDEEEKRIYVGAGKAHLGLRYNVLKIENKKIIWNNLPPKKIFSVTIKNENNETSEAIFHYFEYDSFIEFKNPFKNIYKPQTFKIYIEGKLLAEIEN